MTADISQLEGDHGDEILMEDMIIRPVGIPIKEVRVMARLEEI